MNKVILILFFLFFQVIYPMETEIMIVNNKLRFVSSQSTVISHSGNEAIRYYTDKFIGRVSTLDIKIVNSNKDGSLELAFRDTSDAPTANLLTYSTVNVNIGSVYSFSIENQCISLTIYDSEEKTNSIGSSQNNCFDDDAEITFFVTIKNDQESVEIIDYSESEDGILDYPFETVNPNVIPIVFDFF